MYQELVGDASLPSFLLQIDDELADKALAGGCLHCGARLHSARFPRKVRGGPWGLDDVHDQRRSFCCSRRGCRRRLTPPSVRFVDRHIYLSVVVVLAGLLSQGASRWRLGHLSVKLGVSRRTLVRWRQWWRERFAQTQTWRRLRGRLSGVAPDEALPAAVVNRMQGETMSGRVIALMKLLAPMSASVAIREGCASPAEVAR